ncbi:hypothetical protein [Paraburkholderia sp. HD33-4]|uniref:hypothetical protein n=1 Tax=Paraburkholderia sp. HD33-4 TaxID=2883242 RepID=UPI001F16886F|nr:hypothetical protein [Paraburkholderia sp. HD33-4]
MPDFGAPVADQITSPSPTQGMQTLSGMLGLAKTNQDLQLGQQQLQVGQGQAQMAQQQMAERQLYQSALSSGKDPDGNSIKNPDGSLNYPAVSKFANKYLPISGQAVQQNIISTLDNANTYHTNALKLTNEQRSAVSGVLASGIGEPDSSGVSSRLDQLAQQNPDLVPFIKNAQQAVSAIPPNATPDQRNQVLRHAVQGLQPAGTTANEQAPNMQTTTGPNGGVQAFNVNPNSATPMGAQGPEVKQGIPLGERQQVGTNSVTGGPMIVNRNGGGQITGLTNPPTQGVYVPQPGDAQALPGLSAEREQARSAFANAPSAHTNNQLVLQNIDQVAATGPIGMKARNALSVFGINSNSDAATAYDLVGKGLERSALQAAQSMGPNTNAGLDAQIKANGSLGYTPQAIKEVTKLNDALTTGVQAYQPGLERAIAANPSAGVFAKRQFDQQWGANFDPRIYQMYNAAKSGDTETVNSIVNSLGGKNSPQFKALMQKASALQQLSNTGSAQ